MTDDPLDELQRYTLKRPLSRDVLVRARAAWDQSSSQHLNFPLNRWLAIAAMVAITVDVTVVEVLQPQPVATTTSSVDPDYLRPDLVPLAQRHRPPDPSVTVAALDQTLEHLP